MLLIDIGNTRIKVAIREQSNESKFSFQNSYYHSDVKSCESFWECLAQDLEKEDKGLPKSIAISSVKPSMSDDLLESASEIEGLLHIAKTNERFSLLKNSYSDPNQMGVDRWLAMIAGSASGERGCLVIDAGTAMTLDLVSNSGQHVGGYIILGMQSQLKSLLKATEQVYPGKELTRSDRTLGTNTHDCVINGVFAQTRAFLFEQISFAIEEHQISDVIFTGGDGNRLYRLMNEQFNSDSIYLSYRPELVLEGLYAQAMSQCKKIE